MYPCKFFLLLIDVMNYCLPIVKHFRNSIGNHVEIAPDWHVNKLQPQLFELKHGINRM